MPRVRLALPGAPGPGLAPVDLEVAVAPGETLGRLLARLVREQPALTGLYDPAGNRVPQAVGLTINGRAFHLLGGLTYLLQDGDVVAAAPGQAVPDGQARSQ
jgi:hypothetical protein